MPILTTIFIGILAISTLGLFTVAFMFLFIFIKHIRPKKIKLVKQSKDKKTHESSRSKES